MSMKKHQKIKTNPTQNAYKTEKTQIWFLCTLDRWL